MPCRCSLPMHAVPGTTGSCLRGSTLTVCHSGSMIHTRYECSCHDATTHFIATCEPKYRTSISRDSLRVDSFETGRRDGRRIRCTKVLLAMGSSLVSGGFDRQRHSCRDFCCGASSRLDQLPRTCCLLITCSSSTSSTSRWNSITHRVRPPHPRCPRSTRPTR